MTALRFESLSCPGGKRADLAMVRFNRPPTDEEWTAFAVACADFALAAATRRAKTAKRAECEASQSGPNDSEGNAQ